MSIILLRAPDRNPAGSVSEGARAVAYLQMIAYMYIPVKRKLRPWRAVPAGDRQRPRILLRIPDQECRRVRNDLAHSAEVT